MTEKEFELIDAGVKFAEYEAACLLSHDEPHAVLLLLSHDEPHAVLLASRVLDAAKAVRNDRIEKAAAHPVPVLARAPKAGEILPLEARASWARGCAACALNSIDIAHTCGDS